MPPKSKIKEKKVDFSSQQERKERENRRVSKDLREALDIYRPSVSEYRVLIESISEELSQRIEVPVSIFNSKLAPLETLVTYLRNAGIANNRISDLLNRSKKTISQAYKKDLVVEERESEYRLPIEIFSDRRLSILEAVVWYFRRNTELTLHEIAELIGRDDRTIWTVNSRAKKKRSEGQ